MISTELLLSKLDLMFPDAKCELDYHNLYELLIAVVLSAQTTDRSVNQVTKKLFMQYPDIKSLSLADVKEVELIINRIGLFRNKAKNIINLAITVMTDFQGEIPSTRDELMKLSGVGRKSANVVLAEFFHEPAIAVDTHVYRVAIRLGIANLNDSVLSCEQKLMEYFPSDKWCLVHHQLIFLGRYICHARNPECSKCILDCRR